MQTFLRAIFYAAATIFGACAGAVIGMVLCLILRDGLQWEMPLSRIGIVAGCFAIVGVVMSVAFEHRSMATPGPVQASKQSTEVRTDSSSE